MQRNIFNQITKGQINYSVVLKRKRHINSSTSLVLGFNDQVSAICNTVLQPTALCKHVYITFKYHNYVRAHTASNYEHRLFASELLETRG